jgi:hypothetical protein
MSVIQAILGILSWLLGPPWPWMSPDYDRGTTPLIREIEGRDGDQEGEKRE